MGAGVRHGRREWATCSSSEPVVSGTRPQLLDCFKENVFSTPDLFGQLNRIVSRAQFAKRLGFVGGYLWMLE